MDYNQLLANLQKIRATYLSQEDQKTITQIERRLREKIAAKKIAELPLIQEIVADAEQRVAHIHQLLADDAALQSPERSMERMALYHEKKVHEFWISRLRGEEIDAEIRAIEDFIARRLPENR